jgi:nucleoid DNA-binding protein
MNPTQLTAALAKKLSLSKAEVNQRLEEVVTLITGELTKNNSVVVPGFGTLEVKKQEERIMTNPATGKRILVPPKLAVKFKVANTLKEKAKGVAI